MIKKTANLIPAVFFLYIYIKLNFPLLSKRREDNPSWSRLPSRERGR